MAVRALSIIFVFTFSQLAAQRADSLEGADNKRLKAVVIASGVGYGLSLVALNQLWYKDSEKQPFTFFNDNAEWKQVDKFGHFFSAFQISHGYSRTLQWSGVNKNKADNWGAAVGFLVMLPIEIFDGFSADYGASVGDLFANAAGSTFYLAQSKIWNEIRIHPKFSFHRTGYPDLRDDDVLGDGLLSEIFKDYNGETFWLSFDLDKFFRFPKWLNFAVGYGAHEMVYARDEENEAAGYYAYRQYYVGIDFDLSHIKTRSGALNTLLFFVNMIKLPAPALEISSRGTTFRVFQF